MKIVNGHMDNLYNLLLDCKDDVKNILNSYMDIDYNDIHIKIRKYDLSAQVYIDSEKVRKKYKCKIFLTVNRLNEFEVYDSLYQIIDILSNAIKLKDRIKKIERIRADI